MSTTFLGAQPSFQHARELDGQKLGPAAAARAKDIADAGLNAVTRLLDQRERERRAAGAPERLAQAREQIGDARSKQELEKAFSDAQRALRR